MRRTLLLAAGVIATALSPGSHAEQSGAAGEGASAASAAIALAPTNHPTLPRDLSRLWLVPAQGGATREAGIGDFVEAMKLADLEDYAKALPILTRPSAEQGVLGGYAMYYAGLAQLRLDRAEEARQRFRRVLDRKPIGYLAEAAALAEAEAAEAMDDFDEAAEIYERLSTRRTTAPEEVLMRLGSAAKSAGDLETAAEAFGRVYFEFPVSTAAPLAALEYRALPNVQRIQAGNERYKLELGRAERLFGGRQIAEARKAFLELQRAATGGDRDLIALRLAQSDYYQKRLRSARDGLLPFTAKGDRRAEALYFYGLTLRDLGARADYVRAMRRVIDEYPAEGWAEEALNELATRYIVIDEDDRADQAFRELYQKYPGGRYAERAAWKIGWRSYRLARYQETARVFERAAADFPRSDYRPAWLYWSGRAYDQLERPALANQRYELAAADYLNSYYGRLAVGRLDGRRPPPRVLGEPTAVLPPPPNDGLIRTLLAIGRYDEALNELRYAQRSWGDSASLQATIAWANQQKGQTASGTERFNLLRGSITIMRRAYPQFMASGGEELPREILTTIFPLAYWELIRKHAEQTNLDPYLVAALVAQESTFVADIRSSANAVGLMQLVAPTARAYARKLKIPYSTRLVTNPEANIRMGTAYLSDKIKEFGQLHLALASYNAGERAVHTWIAERPGLTAADEFVDDIPYPETQNYVKRILGTTEDYRRLYGEGN
jgi:soluble lytic murein transglycosylase